MNRIGSVLLVGALACALWVAACSEEEDKVTCEDVCDADEKCSADPEEFDRADCIRGCEDAKLPQEFLACAMDLGCDPSDEQVAECIRKIPPTEACSIGCEKLLACLENLGPVEEPLYQDVRTCASSCTLQFSPEVQECLAAMDETCMGLFECTAGMEP